MWNMEQGHFKRECTNREVQGDINLFHDNYFKKAMYHKPPPQSRPQIEDGSSKPNNRALVVTQEDEGFNWDNYIPKYEGQAMLAEIIEEPEHTDEEEICFDETPETSYSFSSDDDIYNAFAELYYNNIGISAMHREEERIETIEEIIKTTRIMDEENVTNIADKAMMAQDEEEKKSVETEKKDELVSEEMKSEKFEKEKSVKIVEGESEKMRKMS
ncbi:hypothetical protein Hanom_Chr16g01479421 [Helianthus anomalus]